MRMLALIAAAGGCVTQTVHSRPRALAVHEVTFAASPAAAVEVEEGGTAEVAASREVTVWVPSVTTLEKKRCIKIPKLPLQPCIGRDRQIVDAERAHHVTIRELVAGCAAGDCLARRAKDEPIEVGTRTTVSGEAVARGIGGAGALGLATYCLIECEDAGKTFGTAALVVGVLLLYQPLALFAR